MKDELESYKVGLIIGILNFGGAQRQITYLAAGLRESKRIRPVVFCLSSLIEPFGNDLNQHGVEWYHASAGIRPGPPKLHWLLQKVRASQCSLLFGMLPSGNVYTALASSLLGIAYIGSMRNVEAELPLWIKIPYSLSCRRAAYIVCNSQAGADSLRNDLRVYHSRVQVIPNGLPQMSALPTAADSLRRDWGIPEGAIVVGTVARMAEQKRPFFFLEMATWLLQHRPQDSPAVYFIWIGHGPLYAAVKAQQANLPEDIASCIRFLDFRNDIAECLAAMDVFVLTSEYEGLPNALIEAMMAGKPCVVSDVPGIRDVFLDENARNGTAILVDGAYEAFAAELLALMADPDRRTITGENAKSYANEHFSLEVMVSRYEQVFNEVISASKE